EPGLPACHAGVLPLDDRPLSASAVLAGVEPAASIMTGWRAPTALQDHVCNHRQELGVGFEPTAGLRPSVLKPDASSHSPTLTSMDRMGVEPTTPCLQGKVAPTAHAGPFAQPSALYGSRTRLACSTGRSPHPLRHRACYLAILREPFCKV